MTGEQKAPTIIDPGEGGWAPEPKVTTPEVLLYGDLAGPIRLMGQAVAAAADAYSLYCKRMQVPPEGTGDVLDYEIERSYRVYEALQEAYFELASRAMELRRQRVQGGIFVTSSSGGFSTGSMR